MNNEMREKTLREPVWLHFGTGNLFRALPAAIMQRLLEASMADRGIVGIAGRDGELADMLYKPYDCRYALVTLKGDGTTEVATISSIAAVLRLDAEFERIAGLFASPSLQMASFTITEKGYAPSPFWSRLAELLRHRYERGASPLALVSMDNCLRNGDTLRRAVLAAVEDEKLKRYIEERISFPLTMTDKITPEPDPEIAKSLGMTLSVTAAGRIAAPFANAEEAEYLVIEDDFPNGRLSLERAGVLLADRETVQKSERMKVGGLLNPLHTTLAVFGRLFAYQRISEAVRDPLLARLIRRQGFDEALPVTPDPGIIKPRDFLLEVIERRLPNPLLPDTPQRIATDTSQKLPMRFAETLAAYQGESEKLVAVPLAIAGWLRYLDGIDDNGAAFELSPDPLLPALKGMEAEEILRNEAIFPVDLFAVEIGERILRYLQEMSAGPGAVRETLKKELDRLCSNTES